MSKLCDSESNATRQTSKNADRANVRQCRMALVQKIMRTNYTVGIWKLSHLQDPYILYIPDSGHGWTKQDGNKLPLWFEGNVLPRDLGYIVQVTMSQMRKALKRMLTRVKLIMTD